MKLDYVYDEICNSELEIRIGQNAQDNWNIIDQANKHDMWFHLEGKPSCHVILQLPSHKSVVNKKTLNYCANICKANSKFSNHKNIEVIYTEIKYITKGDDVGSVHTKKTKSITV